MARTRKQVEEEFAKRVYGVYKEYEKRIDEKLVEAFEDLRDKGQHKMKQIDISAEGICPSIYASFPKAYATALIELIKEKYKDWNVEYESTTVTFTFYYTPEEETLMSLFHNIEDRFKVMEIDEDDEDDEPYDKISF